MVFNQGMAITLTMYGDSISVQIDELNNIPAQQVVNCAYTTPRMKRQ